MIIMSKKKVINFQTALKHEAFPIIDYFNLTPYNKSIKNIYSNREENIFLIISGIGIQNTKNAIASLCKLKHYNEDNLWVNIGLAGHKSLKVGSIFEIKKVVSNIHNNVFFTNSYYNKLPVYTACCVNTEEKIYKKKYLYDMESFGFLESLDNLTIKENIFMFKIVSDNLKSKPINYKNFAISYISKHIEKINNILNGYRYNYAQNFNDITLILNIVKKKYHVTFYNEKKLEKILTKISVIKNKKEIKREVLISKSLNSLIIKLETYLLKYSLKI